MVCLPVWSCLLRCQFFFTGFILSCEAVIYFSRIHTSYVVLFCDKLFFNHCCILSLFRSILRHAHLLFTWWLTVSQAVVVISQSQAWSLSEKANKQKGVYSVCFATRQLHVKDGTVRPRNNPCQGSNLTPVGQAPARPDFVNQSSQITQQASAASHANDNAQSETTTPATARLASHPTYTGPITKHIPRSARSHVAT